MSILDRLEEEYDKDEAQVFYVGNIQTMKIYLNDLYDYMKDNLPENLEYVPSRIYWKYEEIFKFLSQLKNVALKKKGIKD